MDNRGDKRTLGNDSPSTSQSTQTKKLKMEYVNSERTDAEMHENAKRIIEKCKSDRSENTNEDDTQKLTEYIRKNIWKLDTIAKKKTTVGVFGKTGAGKSSLINAILGEKYLLPSGSLHACTSVIIQVETNVTDSNYLAEIEFISKQDWEGELKTLFNILSDTSEDKDHAMLKTAKEKITALYGAEGVKMSIEDLMKSEYFKEIPEFLDSGRKKITREEALDLSLDIECYTKHNSRSRGCYWPVVKSVTIRVPKCRDFLEHIVLVDIPGTGDYNKARDQMWKSKLRDCSTVWIVSEINRAGSEHEAWELVSSNITDMAQGGECSSMSFICTKTDEINPKNYMRSSKLQDEDFHITPEDSQYSEKKKNACIMHRNKEAKETVKTFFQQEIERHFNCDDNFFSVFTVSSDEFTNDDPDLVLKPEETEIPALRDLLRTYNNSHTNEVITQYISGALGILYLIQGSKGTDDEMVAERFKLHRDLEKNLHNGLEHLYEYNKQIYSSLDKLLSDGAKESEKMCVEIAEQVINPMNKDGRGFHQTLTILCKNDGFYRTKKGETQDLNKCLADHMLKKIDKTFSDVFPVQDNISEKSFQANIDKFTMFTEKLHKSYENSPALSPILNFLKIEEKKMKTMLKEEIVERKKKIYDSIVESIKTTLKPGFKRAAEFTGTGSMLKKQATLRDHIKASKSEIFQKAKREMLQLMDNIMNFTVNAIRTSLMESMKYLLQENSFSDREVIEKIGEFRRLLDQI